MSYYLPILNRVTLLSTGKPRLCTFISVLGYYRKQCNMLLGQGYVYFSYFITLIFMDRKAGTCVYGVLLGPNSDQLISLPKGS